MYITQAKVATKYLEPSSREITVMSSLQLSQTSKHVWTNISTVLLTPLLVNDSQYFMSTGRTHRVSTKSIELNFLCHYLCYFWCCYYSSQWQTIANTLISANCVICEMVKQVSKDSNGNIWSKNYIKHRTIFCSAKEQIWRGVILNTFAMVTMSGVTPWVSKPQ